MTEITDLPAASALAGTELIAILQSGAAAKVTTSAFTGFAQSGTGAVARTVQDKLRESVSVKDFGAVGDGVADDTAALTAFWNSAIANPGILHSLGRKTYLISSPLPTINVGGVWIEGGGSEIHDVGALMTGTVLSWGGGTSSAAFIKIAPELGASAQRIAGIILRGVGVNCVNAIGYGVEVRSSQESTIDVAVANATQIGLLLGVVASLGEAADLQRNRIRLNARQVEADGYVLALDGSSSANTSMNFIEVDCQHYNTPAIRCANSDNNDWGFVRCYRAGGGAATESVQLLGGASLGVASRSERFWFFTASVAMRAYGTGEYTAASVNHQIFSLDKENGTPAPIVDIGASVNWREDDSAMTDNAWLPFTPTITAYTGALTTVSGATGVYRKRGKLIEMRASWGITTNGTGSGVLMMTVPALASSGAMGNAFAGQERAITGKALTGYLDGTGSTQVAVRYADGTYPGTDGGAYFISGTYECVS